MCILLQALSPLGAPLLSLLTTISQGSPAPMSGFTAFLVCAYCSYPPGFMALIFFNFVPCFDYPNPFLFQLLIGCKIYNMVKSALLDVFVHLENVFQ